ncbi:MAG: hypothetical protein M0R40_09530 [Firmicutes bacterium]|nr:hypothetical protein [Bacillota bacterium]
MSRTISFGYDYPYCGYRENAKYGNKWSENRITLNGCYTYPMVFNNVVPGVKHIKVEVDVENTGSGTVFNRSWDFKVYRQSGGWTNILSFTMPSDGLYTIDTDVPNYNITQFSVVPSSNPGSSRAWESWFGVEQLTISESVTTSDLASGEFQYGIFPNRYGIEQALNEVFVNIGGTLTKVKEIFANVDGALVSLPKVYSGYFTSTSEQMKLFEFTPSETAMYRIKQKHISGDHEIRLYDSGFNQMSSGYFYSQAFALNSGSLYYISLTHYYNNTNAGESYLQIYNS